MKLQSIKTSTPPPPKDYVGKVNHNLVTKPYFDWVIFVVVLVDIILIIIQLSYENELATLVFRYINCFIVGVYTSEAILKVCICS